MKLLSTPILMTLKKSELENLMHQVPETLKISNKATSSFTSAQLWQIHNRKKSIRARKFLG